MDAYASYLFTAVIKPDDRAPGGRAITCLLCRLTSYHPEDVAHRYCGNCRIFHHRTQEKAAYER